MSVNVRREERGGATLLYWKVGERLALVANKIA